MLKLKRTILILSIFFFGRLKLSKLNTLLSTKHFYIKLNSLT